MYSVLIHVNVMLYSYTIIFISSKFKHKDAETVKDDNKDILNDIL